MWPQDICQTILRVIGVPIRCPPDAHESSSSPADRATASPGLGQAGKSLRLAGSQENRFVLQDCLTSKAKCDTDLGGGCGAHPTSDRGPRHTDAPSRRSERAALSSSESASYRPARSSAMLNTGQDGQNLTNRGLRYAVVAADYRSVGWAGIVGEPRRRGSVVPIEPQHAQPEVSGDSGEEICHVPPRLRHTIAADNPKESTGPTNARQSGRCET